MCEGTRSDRIRGEPVQYKVSIADKRFQSRADSIICNQSLPILLEMNSLNGKSAAKYKTPLVSPTFTIQNGTSKKDNKLPPPSLHQSSNLFKSSVDIGAHKGVNPSVGWELEEGWGE